MKADEFDRRLGAAMLEEPAVARLVAEEYPEMIADRWNDPCYLDDSETMGEWVARTRVHPAADLDTPAPADDASLVTRGFIQIGQAEWVRIDSIGHIVFNTGPGADVCTLWIGGLPLDLDGDDARAFWVAWTHYLADGE
jgi:hypothetical protein